MGSHTEDGEGQLLLTPAQCAARLHLGHSTIHALLASGQIASIVVGSRARRIPVAALDEWVQRQLADQASAPSASCRKDR
jgi:excisionase family DNA binding protein